MHSIPQLTGIKNGLVLGLTHIKPQGNLNTMNIIITAYCKITQVLLQHLILTAEYKRLMLILMLTQPTCTQCT